MSDIKLFRYDQLNALELVGKAAWVEKQLQTLIESQMETFLGVRFLATEYETGKTHKGRIDSLGLDENDCPVIVEYKRSSNENVITQGLFYLDWLLDHKAEFIGLVTKKLGAGAAEKISWSGTRLLCIAGDFNKYDEHAISQIDRNIELIRYKLFGDDLLLLELSNRQTATTTPPEGTSTSPPAMKTQSEVLETAPAAMLAFYEELRAFILSLGDDVQEHHLKFYTAFRRLKNFTCVTLQQQKLRVFLKLDPSTLELEEGFTKDMTGKGHWGTGDLEVSIYNAETIERAKTLIEQSYQEN